MKRFLFKTSLFCIPLVLVWLSIEIFYRQVPNNYSVKNQQIKKNSIQIEVLLFGDSHCLYGLNPKYFTKKTFNLSNVSQTIYFDKLLFEKHIANLPKLKQVVFCIEYTNLSQVDNTGDDDWRKFLYQRFMNLEVPIISKYDPRNCSLALIQSISKSKDLIKRYFKNGTIVDCDSLGWGNNYKKEDRIPPMQIAKRRAIVQEDGLIDFELNRNRMQEIIQQCKKRNIQVLIVSMPQTKVFESYLNQNKLKAIKKTCADFQYQNKNTAYYLNLFDDTSFSDEDFYDADHLNNVGAVKCSKIVNDYLMVMESKIK
jgi:hypothetical protein